jgi:Luciferase-like monooxygenase
MEFVANFMSAEIDPVVWSRDREAEGWPILGCADHMWSGVRAFPHAWVTLGAMAVATNTATLTTSFANNLFRSPVEFAQASLQMHAITRGRFEAGLGAGWSRDEAEGSGIGYPSAGERAGRYIEAVRIVREIFDTGMCTYEGRYYNVRVPTLGPLGRPPLVASLGGERTIREIAPVVDRVELKVISEATRDGSLDFEKVALIPRSHLTEMVERVRTVNPTVPIGVFILCGVGQDKQTKFLEDLLQGTFFGGFFGSATKVADSMKSLEAEGITRVQVSPFGADAFELLAPELF